MKKEFEADGMVADHTIPNPGSQAAGAAPSPESRAAEVAATVARAAIEQADHAMRNWTDPTGGPVRIGSPEHLRMFCNMLLQTHNPYKPAIIEWPKLSPDALERVTSLPIGDIAVQTERHASVRWESFAGLQRDPLLRSALEMDGDEEARHKVVLSKLVEAYGITLEPEPEYLPPSDIEWGWLVTGYSECIDSFAAFGLFAAAKNSGFFPAELVETFEPVIQEEGRHILFFVNWVAWYRANQPWWHRPAFAFKVFRVWLFLIRERIGLARQIEVDEHGGGQDANFPLNAAETLADSLSAGAMIDLCLVENERRMAGYDARLLRPTTVPKLARFARRFFK